jgi:hypothetical protein
MPASATTCFAQRSMAVMPPGLPQALGPVLQQIAEMTLKIKQYDRQIQQLGQTEYPGMQALLKAHGVGHLTALTFVLKSFDIGTTCPEMSASGMNLLFSTFELSVWVSAG